MQVFMVTGLFAGKLHGTITGVIVYIIILSIFWTLQEIANWF